MHVQYPQLIYGVGAMNTSQFTRLELPADFRTLDGYVDCIDPTQVSLKRVVQPYFLRTVMRCSLTTCRQEHLEGVLVELEDGRFSNIGHVCGSRPENFGEQFSRELKLFGEEQVRSDAIRRLQDRSTIIARFDEILRLQRQCHLWQGRINAFLASFEISAQLQSRLRQSAGRLVVEEHERTTEEIDRLLDLGTFTTRAQARYYQVTRGEIRGLEATARFPIEELHEIADRLRTMDPLVLSTRDMLTRVRELGDLEAGIALAKKWIAAAETFLAPANFAVMAYLPLPNGARERLAALTLDKIDDTIASSKAPNGRTANVRASGTSKSVSRHARRLEAQLRAAKRPLFIEK
jgi:hypothetical protein